MADVKLTKTELRAQQIRFKQLLKYLPTLQLKKSLLQGEVNEARVEVVSLENAFHADRLQVSHASALLSEKFGVDLKLAAKVDEIQKHYDNIAGIEIPIFEGVSFEPFEYSLFATPAWLDAAVDRLRQMAIAKAKVRVAEEKREALEKELREVSIRVNLFEKNLIPKTTENIRKIKVFLGDQELAAVSQSKVAKTKIMERKAKQTRQAVS